MQGKGSRATGCTPLGFLFALHMKYARTSAATTSTAGTTTDATRTAVFFLDGLVILLHILISESYLKCIRQQGQSLLWESKSSFWLANCLVNITEMTLSKIQKYSNGKNKYQEENQNLKISDPV